MADAPHAALTPSVGRGPAGPPGKPLVDVEEEPAEALEVEVEVEIEECTSEVVVACPLPCAGDDELFEHAGMASTSAKTAGVPTIDLQRCSSTA